MTIICSSSSIEWIQLLYLASWADRSLKETGMFSARHKVKVLA